MVGLELLTQALGRIRSCSFWSVPTKSSCGDVTRGVTLAEGSRPHTGFAPATLAMGTTVNYTNKGAFALNGNNSYYSPAYNRQKQLLTASWSGLQK